MMAKTISQLEAEIIFLRERLERVADLARQEQGEWAAVDSLYAPLWTQPLKDIVEVAELALNETEAVAE